MKGLNPIFGGTFHDPGLPSTPRTHLPMSTLAVVAALAYLLGSIPWSLVVGRAMGVDIRQHGSGNAGATNAWRVLGKGPGLLVFALDFLKGLAAVLLASRVRLAGGLPDGPDAVAWAEVLAGTAAMLGHVYTLTGRLFFGSWRGGKGVATGGGMLVGLVPIAVLVAAGVFVAAVALTRYVSIGSILAAVTIPVVLLVRMALGVAVPGPILGFALVVPLFIAYTHRANVRRLLAGTEARVSDPARPIEEG
jgi:glycerol-3-phosphate acyltransferase PlsY